MPLVLCISPLNLTRQPSHALVLRLHHSFVPHLASQRCDWSPRASCSPGQTPIWPPSACPSTVTAAAAFPLSFSFFPRVFDKKIKNLLKSGSLLPPTNRGNNLFPLDRNGVRNLELLSLLSFLVAANMPMHGIFCGALHIAGPHRL